VIGLLEWRMKVLYDLYYHRTMQRKMLGNIFFLLLLLASIVQFWTFASSYFLAPQSILTYGKTPLMSDQLTARPLPTQDNTT
jgi:hypothetical protein